MDIQIEAEKTWAYIERLLTDECGLPVDCGLGRERPNCINAIKNGLLPRETFAWLIEKGSGSDLRYYAPTEPGEWTADHLKACRFARKEDAEAIQWQHVSHGHLPVLGTRVCEHGWL